MQFTPLSWPSRVKLGEEEPSCQTWNTTKKKLWGKCHKSDSNLLYMHKCSVLPWWFCPAMHSQTGCCPWGWWQSASRSVCGPQTPDCRTISSPSPTALSTCRLNTHTHPMNVKHKEFCIYTSVQRCEVGKILFLMFSKFLLLTRATFI